ncbi:hypothetical protein HDV04_003777 [Boothiomyces sp. JEL0838]|nr:hypothetical protein HDV04_003777 [Boothiomyces sp. JEL0838]
MSTKTKIKQSKVNSANVDIVGMFENYNFQLHPKNAQVQYTLEDFEKYFDNIKDIGLLVLDSDSGTYLPISRNTIKKMKTLTEKPKETEKKKVFKRGAFKSIQKKRQKRREKVPEIKETEPQNILQKNIETLLQLKKTEKEKQVAKLAVKE